MVSLRVSEEKRAKLRAAGLWEQFKTRRDELKAEGISSRKAREMTLEELLPLCEENEKTGNSSIVDEPLGEPLESEGSTSHTTSYLSADTRTQGVDPSIFEGKEDVSVVSAIQWVARNLEVRNPKPEDAPSAEAWGMLQSYGGSRTRKHEFWDKVFTKLIPSRAQLETTQEVTVDDAGMQSVLDRLLEIKREAEF